jgi:predicted RecA/RadA family phage recombinase
MKNFKYHGQNKTFIADAAYVSGDVVVVGEFVGINSYDVASGEEGEMSLTGVYEVKKEAALVIVDGEKAYWDADSKEVDNKAGDDSSNIEMGVFFKAELTGSVNAQVLLKGGSRAFN